MSLVAEEKKDMSQFSVLHERPTLNWSGQGDPTAELRQSTATFLHRQQDVISDQLGTENEDTR